jgi:aminopeptidase N
LKIIFLLLIILISNLKSQSSDPDLFPDKNYDVIKYQANLDFSQTSETSSFITGSNTFLIAWEENANPDNSNITFHLENLTVNSVKNSDGDKLDFSIENEENIELKHYLVQYKSGSNFEGIVIDYEGEMTKEDFSSWGGVHNNQSGMYGIGVGFRNPYVSTTRHWLPCFDHPSDKAEYDLTFKTNGDREIISIGNKKIIEDSETDYIVNWSTNIPTASYLVSFFHGDFVTTSFPGGEIPNEVYHNEIYQDQVDLVFHYTNEMVASLADALDEPYPYEKIGHYVMSTPAAMEHQTLIAFGSDRLFGYYNDNDSLGNTVVHELGHHWFGNMVSPKSFADAWLNESFTTQSEAIFFENYFNDEKRYWKRIREHGNDFLGGTFSNDGAIPIYGYDRSKSTNYPGTIYRKGSVMLALLRYKIGQEKYFEALSEYIDRYKFVNAGTEDAINVFEEISENSHIIFTFEFIYHFW